MLCDSGACIWRTSVFVLSRTDCDLCSAGMWPPAVLRGGGSRLLPAGRTHPVQELQRSPHPGPVGQNLHRLLTNLTLISRTRYMLLIHKTVQTDEGPAPLLCGLDINIAIVPSVGSKSCRVTFSVTSYDDTLAFLFDAQLIFRSSVFSGLICRQLGLLLPFSHTGTAQLLAHTLLLWRNGR